MRPPSNADNASQASDSEDISRFPHACRSRSRLHFMGFIEARAPRRGLGTGVLGRARPRGPRSGTRRGRKRGNYSLLPFGPGCYRMLVSDRCAGGGFRREVQPRRQHWFLNEKVGFPRPHPRLLLGFQGTKSARREGMSSPFNDAGGCTSPQNSGGLAAQSSKYPVKEVTFIPTRPVKVEDTVGVLPASR
jgi:hypothetical protein